MGVLANPQHELFAQALAAGKNQTDAYEAAGYKANSANRACSSRLATKANVIARVAELQGRAVNGVVLTKQWIIEKLIENASRAAALERPDGSTVNRALELLGKEQGMFIDRGEVTNYNYGVSDKPATAKEWTDEHAEKRAVPIDPTKPDDAVIN